MLGILKAGGAFVPLSPAIPQERLDTILEECALQWIIVGDDVQDRLSSLSTNQNLHVLSLSSDVNGNPATDYVPVERDGDDLAYIFFTSGSTGKPKGIAGR